MKVKLADVLGNEQTKRVGFSYYYLFLGPFHMLFTGRFLLFILLIGIYYYLLPIPGMNYAVRLLYKIPNLTRNNMRAISDTLMFFRQVWHLPFNYIGISICLALHIYVAFKCDASLLRRTIRRKKLFPSSEEDARILIKYHVLNYDVKLAPKNGIQSLYGYKSAEQLWLEKNMMENTSHSTSPLLDALSPLPKDEKIRRRDHLNKLLKNREITIDEYKVLVDRLRD